MEYGVSLVNRPPGRLDTAVCLWSAVTGLNTIDINTRHYTITNTAVSQRENPHCCRGAMI